MRKAATHRHAPYLKVKEEDQRHALIALIRGAQGFQLQGSLC